MSASPVGSEMCIRDSSRPGTHLRADSAPRAPPPPAGRAAPCPGSTGRAPKLPKRSPRGASDPDRGRPAPARPPWAAGEPG
eukprot:12189154-Alexandrium_andersonii.AAC.1